MAKNKSARLPAKSKTVTVDRDQFQMLHSAGRSLFQNALKTQDHSPDTLVYLTLLNDAIDEGHKVLGTHRPTADEYIELVSNITTIQRANAEKFLKEADAMLTNNDEDVII